MKIKFKDEKEKASWVEIPPETEIRLTNRGTIDPDTLPICDRHSIRLHEFVWSLQKGKKYLENSILNWVPGYEGDVVLRKKNNGEIVFKDAMSLGVFARECFTRGAVYVRDEIETAYERGEITDEDVKTLKSYLADAVKALINQKEMWQEERSRRIHLEHSVKGKTKKRRGNVPSDTELKKAHENSKSWVQMANYLTKKTERKITDKTVKDLWTEFCQKNDVPFSEKFSE